jgi:hypothetical protein
LYKIWNEAIISGCPPTFARLSLSNKYRTTTMKLKLILALLFSLGFVHTKAQRFVERVYLKDSTYHEGYIIEQEPTKFLKVDRIKQKDTVTVPFGDIWKLTKIYVIDSAKSERKTREFKKDKHLKTAYAELLGNAGLYSINFDMRTQKGKRNGWGVRAGIEYLGFLGIRDSLSALSFSLLGLPFAVNYLFGSKRGFLELGLGATWLRVKAKVTSQAQPPDETVDIPILDINVKEAIVIGTLNIGYRYMPYESGIMFRAVIAPLIAGNEVIPSVGLSVGYKF